jgi:putative ABC transport system permease protein
MQTLFADIRYAFRMIGKSPGFALLAIFAFALGIGANTAIFSVVNAVLLRPLPYPQSERLILLRESTPSFPDGSVGYPNYLDWRAAQHSFTDLALLRREAFNVSRGAGAGANPERVPGARVSANFLGVLGLKPAMGRDFTEADDMPNGNKVALITDAAWRRRFGAAADVLGQHILMDGISREIIGILPPNVQTPRLAEIYLPLDDLRASKMVLSRGNHPGFSALGRLKPGVTLSQARADLEIIARDLEQRYPETNTARRIPMQLLLESAVGEHRQSLYLLLGAVGCVLLIACANIANLQLARILARGKELAVRTALGASGWRLTRQVLTESAVLSLLGAMAGIVLAIWSLDAILALSPAGVPRFQESRIDLAALAFTVGIALLAGLLVGLWPAWRVSRNQSLALALHDSARGSSEGTQRQRARGVLVITQVALAVILLVGAAVTVKSFWRAQQAPLGFNPHGLLTMRISLPQARYDKASKISSFYDQLVAHVSALPGVVGAAVSGQPPFGESDWDSYFHLTGTPEPRPGQEQSIQVDMVSPDYFRVMGMPILRGRGFDATDIPGRARSVIVDETFVERYLPGKDPIGQLMDDNWTDEKNPPPMTIIGVVARARLRAPGEENIEKLHFPQTYFCSRQFAEENCSLIVRVASGDPLAPANAVKHEVQALDPDQPVASVITMEKSIEVSLAARRLTMTLLGAFGALALVLATVGIYGVMALSTTQRTRELGIRLALGASRGDVLRLILGQGISLIVIGLVAGLLGPLRRAVP